jgi:hypothetical protein
LNQPQGAFYEPETNKLFVAGEGDGTVKIFDGTSLQLVPTVTLDLDADNVRCDGRNKHIVVGFEREKVLAGGKATRAGGGGAQEILMVERALSCQT